VRAYLEGQAAHRRGDYPESVARFEQALELDSTFALAGWALATAAGWTTAPGAARRGLELAWAGRDQLSPRDRALLVAEVGPRYPAPSSLAEYLAAWEHAVDIGPDQPDRWYELGDVYFHDGPYLGIRSSRRRAAEAFRRAVALDSGTAQLGHLLEVAVVDGDTGAVRRLGAIYLARDSAGELRDFYRWRIATGLHDTLALRKLRERSGEMTLSSLWRIMNHAVLDGTHLDDADHAAAAIRSQAGSGSEWQRGKVYLRAYELNRGRPQAALADTAGSDESEYGPHAALYQRALDALYGDGDSASGAQAARELSRDIDRPLAAGNRERATQYTDLCVAELWRVEHAQLGSASRTITRIRSANAPDDSPQTLAINAACATILEAMVAGATGRPDAAAALDRLDSLLRAGPGGLRNGPAIAFTLSPGFVKSTIGITPVGFEEFANLILARLHERRGDRRAALAAVRRRAYAYHRIEYLASHLREEARLAALTGDRASAIRAYRHYLSLRSDPEPALRPAVERVRAEFVRLGGPPASSFH
jgi:tetratricopeptide (TPR) repeat protein